MNKKVLNAALWIVAFSLIAVLFYFQFANKPKLVYVDSQKLLNGYKEMKAARKNYEGQIAVLKANLDTLGYEAQSVITEYESKKSRLSPKEKQLMEELANSKHTQFVNYDQVVNEKIKSFDQELTTTYLGRANDFIKKYGMENHYDIIMAATQFGNIVYAENNFDITDEILEGLNEE